MLCKSFNSCNISNINPKKLLAKEESSRLDIVPAKFEWGTERVVVKEASKKVIEVPATYKWDDRKSSC